MPKKAKKFDLVLTPTEAGEFQNPPISSKGGRQQLERKIYKQVHSAPHTLTLDDKELGTVLRYMCQYDKANPPATGGGLQGRLIRGLGRALKDKTGL